SDNASIQSVVSKYQSALNSLDVSAAKEVWPNVDSKALERAFGALEKQDLRFESCRTEVFGDEAVASCKGNGTYVPKVGSRHARSDTRAWTFKLLKTGNEWVIAGVNSQ